ncbi:MAG: carboxyl transferase domain-containing protein [Myxococcota bacterium]
MVDKTSRDGTLSDSGQTDPHRGLRDELAKRNAQALLGGGQARIDKQHAASKLTARERIELLLDAGSFVEMDRFRVHRCTHFGMDRQHIPGDSVVIGFGTIDNRQVCVYAQDFTVFGGSLSEVAAQKICKLHDFALKVGAPVVGLIDSGGARIQEGVASLAGYAEIFYRNTMASGVVPQISVMMGPAAGGAVYSPALTDFIFMVKETSCMFLTGPDVIKTVTQEEVTMQQLGGSEVHASKSGVAHFVYPDDAVTLDAVRNLLGFLPSNNGQTPPAVTCHDDPNRRDERLRDLIPTKSSSSYDVNDVITCVVDEGLFVQVQPHFARNILVGFARLAGRCIGVVANQPQVLAGAIDMNAADKAARFVRFCDCFNIPIVTLVDVPGFLPGIAQEHGGIIRHGAKLLFAYAEATVPKITVVLRKAYGGAYCVMGPKQLRADLNFALPTAQLAVMGAEAATRIVMRREIDKADNKQERAAQLAQDYANRFENPYQAAQLGYIDEVIFPQDMRPRLCQALLTLASKRDRLLPKKHGNVPL